MSMANSHADKPRSLDPLIDVVLAGRYRVERLIGRGGMGLVYLCHDDHDNRKVVIKLLAPHLHDDSTAISRFEREGRRLKQLAHPNVVAMLECGHHGDQLFIAMEYLDGEPLRRYLQRRSALPLIEFTPIASQVLAAVGFAHDRSIMLRDIKPANIMLCERAGRANFVKLLDFGLAKLVDGDDDQVTKSHVIGTAGYLAPEQIKGEATDLRVDVYALGVLFYMMLTGHSPIVGENDGALLYNHVHGIPKPLRAVLPSGHGVPPQLIALVHQCLEKDPARRPADANEIVEVMFECIPPGHFSLPLADEASRRAMQDYRDSRDRRIEDDLQPSSEWTKPVARPSVESPPGEVGSGVKPLPRRPSQSVPGIPQPIHDRGGARGSAPRRPSAPDIPPPQEGGRRPAADATSRPGPAPRPLPSPSPKLPRPRPNALRRPTPIAATGISDLDAREPLADPVRSVAVELPTVAANGAAKVDAGIDVSVAMVADDVPMARGSADSTPIPVEPPVGFQIRRRWLVVAGIAAVLVGGAAALMFGPGRGAGGSVATSPAAPPPAPSTASTSTPPSPIIPVPSGKSVATQTRQGSVEVRALEGARIEVDGVDYGPAPLSTPLPVGTHRIRVIAPGYLPWEDTIEIVEGENPSIEARLRSEKRRGRANKAAPAHDEPPMLEDLEDDRPELLPDKPPPPGAPAAPATPRRPPPAPDVRREVDPFLPSGTDPAPGG